MSVEWMIDSRQAEMSRESASSESDARMWRLESGGVKRPIGETKSVGDGMADKVLTGTSKLDNNAGADFVV